jgi:hypothetical protein
LNGNISVTRPRIPLLFALTQAASTPRTVSSIDIASLSVNGIRYIHKFYGQWIT